MMIENFDVDSIKFDDNGLVVAIAADAVTNEVLMQAYMDRVALTKTLETREAHYYSRSRRKLWRKGETSGHVQKVVSIMSDCDNDSILLRVLQTGAACHTGKRSCFFNNRVDFDDVPNLCAVKDELVAIRDRRANPKLGSYTNYLFDKGKEKICKKIGEEASECIIAAMKGDNSELSNEVNDLLYHLFVLLENQNVDPLNVLSVMQDRRGKPRIREY